ncbi:phosphonate C-P lyase system protein PhnG [Nitratireductor thuwali]|uniref:Alpha-D-ribose 1-methylphosphonate 5-triphosphate synthase subunit PhnG n=1 Tax=Nitratireductor thuwali TaxID=2267699 RepID=A0ABY5MJ06_9HYPH|nr:Alpha-D-ribose 1-methylphosphonate 5-triphosphate synthase subunit PhnG [Nitratireductor thuwali]
MAEPEQSQFSRREAMAVLARAPEDRVMALFAASGLPEAATALRGPETGLVALRGRIGGGGAAFNFGEATVTRASVKLPTGEIGHSYALGRAREKARVAAVIDALAQKPENRARIADAILAPLRAEQREADGRRREETAATQVDFFTMTRGED